MDVRLGALDVVVQVVSEKVDEVDGVVASILVGVTREEDEGDVADLFADASVGTFQTSRGIAAEEDLRSSCARTAALFEFLGKKK